MSVQDLKSKKTPELVALYNQLSGKSIKKFSSRAAGEKQVAKLLAKAAPQARTVKGTAGAGTSGRPEQNFNVALNGKGTSKITSASLRRQLLDWLEGRDAKSAEISAINTHFKRNMRGVVAKLREKDWVKVTNVAK